MHVFCNQFCKFPIFSDDPQSPVGAFTHSAHLDPVEEFLQDDALSDTKSENASSIPPMSLVSAKTSSGLSWVHLLGYTAILQRMCSLDSVGVRKESTGTESPAGFDAGCDDLETVANHDVVRSPLLSTTAMLRLNRMLSFLHSHLPVFANKCLAMEPPTNLVLTTNPPATEIRIPAKSYAENVYLAENAVAGPKILTSAEKDSERSPTVSTGNELCMQWYQPEFEVATSPGGYREVFLLFAIGEASSGKSSPSKDKTATSGVRPILGKLTLPLKQLLDLHGKLAELRQKGDISLSDKVGRLFYLVLLFHHICVFVGICECSHQA